MLGWLNGLNPIYHTTLTKPVNLLHLGLLKGVGVHVELTLLPKGLLVPLLRLLLLLLRPIAKFVLRLKLNLLLLYLSSLSISLNSSGLLFLRRSLHSALLLLQYLLSTALSSFMMSLPLRKLVRLLLAVLWLPLQLKNCNGFWNISSVVGPLRVLA